MEGIGIYRYLAYRYLKPISLYRRVKIKRERESFQGLGPDIYQSGRGGETNKESEKKYPEKYEKCQVNQAS